jgi:hypothetical protein
MDQSSGKHHGKDSSKQELGRVVSNGLGEMSGAQKRGRDDAEENCTVDWTLLPKDLWRHLMCLLPSVFDVVALSRTCKRLSHIEADPTMWRMLLKQKPGLCEWHEMEAQSDAKGVYFECEGCSGCTIPDGAQLSTIIRVRAEDYHERVTSERKHKRDAQKAWERLFEGEGEAKPCKEDIEQWIPNLWEDMLMPEERAAMMYGLAKIKRQYGEGPLDYLYSSSFLNRRDNDEDDEDDYNGFDGEKVNLYQYIVESRWTEPWMNYKRTVDEWISLNFG